MRFAKSTPILVAWVVSWMAAMSPAEEIVAPENKLKSAFLYNFALFTKWPTNAFASADAPLVIGVLGQDPFGATLDDTVKGKTAGNRPIVVQRFRRVDDIKSCHVLFISQSEKGWLDETLATLDGRSILTVSDLSGFCQQRGMIRLFPAKHPDKKGAYNIKFEICPETAAAVQLTLSSKMLRLAEIICPPKEGR